MRSLFVVVLLVVGLYLVSHSADGDVSLNLKDPPESYNVFIEKLRDALKNGSTTAKGIPILRQKASDSERYLKVHLTSKGEQNNTITLGIDVVNVYVLAYKANNHAFYLNDTSPAAYDYIFPKTKWTKLNFSGSYGQLSGAAGSDRESTSLGLSRMSFAVDDMFYNKKPSLVAKGFLVLVQAVAEASRFKLIEGMISDHVFEGFKPDDIFISLENNWGALSKQIQIAEKKGTDRFDEPVKLKNGTSNFIKITDVNSKYVKEMGLLLYKNVMPIYDEGDEQDTDAMSKISVGVGGSDQIISTAAASAAAAMEMESYRYSLTHRKSFLNRVGRFKMMDKDIPARHAIAAM